MQAQAMSFQAQQAQQDEALQSKRQRDAQQRAALCQLSARSAWQLKPIQPVEVDYDAQAAAALLAAKNQWQAQLCADVRAEQAQATQRTATQAYNRQALAIAKCALQQPVSYTHLDVYKRQHMICMNTPTLNTVQMVT